MIIMKDLSVHILSLLHMLRCAFRRNSLGSICDFIIIILIISIWRFKISVCAVKRRSRRSRIMSIMICNWESKIVQHAIDEDVDDGEDDDVVVDEQRTESSSENRISHRSKNCIIRSKRRRPDSDCPFLFSFLFFSLLFFCSIFFFFHFIIGYECVCSAFFPSSPFRFFIFH